MEEDGEQFEDAKERFDNPEVGGKDKDDIKYITRNWIVSERLSIDRAGSMESLSIGGAAMVRISIKMMIKKTLRSQESVGRSPYSNENIEEETNDDDEYLD